MVEVVLYSREECHLCEQARDVIISLQKEFPISLTEIDIDEDPSLKKKYGLKIPVIAINGEVIFESNIDIDRLKSYLQTIA